MLDYRDEEEDSTIGELPGAVSRATLRGAPGQAARELLHPLGPSARRFRDQVKQALQDPLFTLPQGLNAEQRSKLSYERFRFLRRTLDLRARDVRDDPNRLMTALELVGTVDGTLFTLMSIHYFLCTGSLLRHGNEAEMGPYLDELDRLDSIGTFLATELGYGNNVVSLRTRADYDPDRDEVIISTPALDAVKFMPNTGLAGVPKLGVVMARLFVHGRDEGVIPIVVRLSTAHGARPGITIRSIGEKPGYFLDNAMTSFDRVRVPRKNVLTGASSQLSPRGFTSRFHSKRERFLHSLEQVQLGRLGLSAATASIFAASVFIAIKYSEQRRSFASGPHDVALLEYGNHQRDLLTALAHAYASRLMVNAALDECNAAAGVTHDRAFRVSASTKAHVTYAAQRHMLVCRERCGAVGLFEHNRIAAYASYCHGSITAEGDNHIVLLKIARQMLLGRDYTQPSPATPAAAGDLPLSKRLAALLGARERLLLAQLRRGMSSALRKRRSFDTWNEHLTLALEVAAAHAARLAFDVFDAALGGLEPNHPVADLALLYGLSELSPHLGFYLAEGLITAEEVHGHRAAVQASCRQLRPHALTLAEAFDIPNSVLRAPIASDDYMSAYWLLTHGGAAPSWSTEASSASSSSAQAPRSLPVVPTGNDA